MKEMSMKSGCSPMGYPGKMMAKFLGILMLGMGVNMLLNYTGSVNYMMGIAGKMSLGSLMPLANFVSSIISWTWPVVATLIGLSYLTHFKRCIASCVLMCYLVLFALCHIWTGDIAGATWDVVVALFVSVMRAFHVMMGKMCEMPMTGKKK
jgi:hypothetical protein